MAVWHFWLTDGCALSLMMVSVCYYGFLLQWEGIRNRRMQMSKGAVLAGGGGGVEGGRHRMDVLLQEHVRLHSHAVQQCWVHSTKAHCSTCHTCTHYYASHTSRLAAQAWIHTHKQTLKVRALTLAVHTHSLKYNTVVYGVVGYLELHWSLILCVCARSVCIMYPD